MAEDKLDDTGPMQLQLQQAVETFRFQMGLLVQVWGFLIAADAVLIGYSLTQRKAVLIAVASVMPILMFLAVRAIYSHGLPFLYTAVSLERALMPDRDTLTASYARIKFPVLYGRILTALEMSEPNARDQAVRQGLSGSSISRGMPRLFAVGYLSHVVLFMLALTVFDYPFM